MQGKSIEIEVKVGLFVIIGVGLIMMAIISLGGANQWITSQSKFNSYFENVNGIVVGSKVMVGGMRAGVVNSMEFDDKTEKIQVQFTVEKEYRKWVRENSKVEVKTQGIMGDNYLSIVAGKLEFPELKEGSTLETSVTGGLGAFLSKSDELLARLKEVAGSLERILKNFEKDDRDDRFFEGMARTATNLGTVTADLKEAKLKSAINHLNGIMSKINRGKGTLGALVNDPALYDDAKQLLGGANRSRVMRNLVRQTLKEGEEKEARDNEKQ